jgi:glycosyltransferase involved in cell wall biosynthesis
MTGTVSVLMATYNRGRFIGEALDSVMVQSRRPLEVVVVDDGSTDNAPSVLQSYAGLIRLVSRPHEGEAAALRVGFSLCRGDYVYKFDSDDVLEPNACEVLAGLLDTYPEVGVAYGNVAFMDAEGHPIGVSHLPRPLGLHHDIHRLIRQNFIAGAAALFRATAWPKAGRVLPTTDMGEDWELWLRMGLNGWAFFGTDLVLARYRRHQDNQTHDRHWEHAYREHIELLKKVLEDFPAADAAVRKEIERTIQVRMAALGYLALDRQCYAEAKAWFRQSSGWFQPATLGGLIAATVPPAYKFWRYVAKRPLQRPTEP